MINEITVYMNSQKQAPKLFAVWRGGAHEFFLSQRQALGRPSGKGQPQLSVPVDTVSRVHGEFVTAPFDCRYRDLGSTNGTLYNGKPLPPNEFQILTDGDVLRIHGREDENFELDVILVYSTSYRDNTCWNTQQLNADIAEIAVGREEAVELRDIRVSRRHASFFQSSGGWAIIDHGSLNGVFVNNRRLRSPVYLKPMDVIRIAGYLFLYAGDRLIYQKDYPEDVSVSHTAPGEVRKKQKQKQGGLSIYIEERNVWRRMKKRTLLKDIRLEIPDGSMVLILGGSGAGKTTFMNAVMGYEPAEGQILYHDTDIYDEYEKMKYEIGYVPQQDLLRMNDTVYSTLLNAARMRLPAKFSPEYYIARVEDTMKMLGLERERDSLAGKLSGGQRKRLSIAVEYIGNPALFFLDEPDSGLDGTMARALMENLRGIADDGKIVLVISHSPDRGFELFDQVIVLARGSRDNSGRLAYVGAPEDACAFFDTNSLEGIVKRINRLDEGGDGMADYYIERFSAREEG